MSTDTNDDGKRRRGAAEERIYATLERLETRIARLEAMFDGRCPGCDQSIRNWEVVREYHVRMSMTNSGFDPDTGHLLSCPDRGIRL